MSGSKKSSGPKVPALPAALPGPALNAAPPPQPMPGQLDLIAQQLGQGYPSMPPAQLQQHLQSIYAPPKAAPAPVLPAATGSGIGGIKLTPGEALSIYKQPGTLSPAERLERVIQARNSR